MDIPVEPIVFGVQLNIHLLFEYLAFFVGFRYYIYLRKRSNNTISSTNRLSIIIGAVFGAFLGSRVFGYLEHPIAISNLTEVLQLLNSKTIMGGLFGGLLGVEVSKKIIGEQRSSGDLFVYPLLLAILIGRIGCFLNGINEFTYGVETDFFLGMDLGDGIHRHPLSVYEIFFLIALWIFLRYKETQFESNQGLLFRVFMIGYFSFRFLIEFLKPNEFLILGLSSIQYLCILCLLYYRKTIAILFSSTNVPQLR
ncbi:prolipoprotein diacylglyceryl transferase [Aquimarina intermedia]|uniref:Prolipoprotein diacylglyceryltransferase n=1 Tax=Aquimarina intermedia TaxID=350814 RepID=A0A5S5C2H3_9FLAO|nr:prolipoprotein diacylglyceryl transferase family protein [Aquimarina intermedia]TYP73621.1 prolipoprotein diacylglyceryltransferase [Aquimarina intermedia]